SKRALAAALAEAGIDYEHLPELGNLKPNRAGFAGDDWALAEARSVFRARLETPEAAQALTRVEQASAVRLVALLCFEADQRRCHRDVILAALADRFAAEAGSTPRGR